MVDPGGLGRGEVHAWHGHVDAAANAAAQPRESDLATLSAQERARCRRFVRPADSVRFAAVHAAVRRVLAGYLDVEPAAIQFGRSRCCECGQAEHGPPRIDWPATGISCNLSGSAGHWLLAVTRDRRIGADIEVPRDLDVGQMAGASLTAAEQDYLRSQPEAGRLRLFYRCWTRKEAVLKACGVGLAGSLRKLDAAPAHTGPVELTHSCRGGPGRWAVQDLPAGEDAGAGHDLTPEPCWLGAVAQPAAGAGRVWLLDAAPLLGSA